jgi:rubrerythrin
MQVLTKKKAPVRRSPAAEQVEKESSHESVEILAEGQECPFCHFAKLQREGDEVICPVCGYGRRACT